jgi:hypothetical protein
MLCKWLVQAWLLVPCCTAMLQQLRRKSGGWARCQEGFLCTPLLYCAALAQSLCGVHNCCCTGVLWYCAGIRQVSCWWMR